MATLLRVPHTNCRISQESVGDVAAREISRLTKRPRQLSPLVRSTWIGPRAITSYSLRRTRQTIFGRFFRFGLWPKFPGDIERPRERKSVGKVGPIHGSLPISNIRNFGPVFVAITKPPVSHRTFTKINSI